MKSQVLDTLELERERGITIKAQSVSLKYEFRGQIYELNLIDTPDMLIFHMKFLDRLQHAKEHCLSLTGRRGLRRKLYQLVIKQSI